MELSVIGDGPLARRWSDKPRRRRRESDIPWLEPEKQVVAAMRRALMIAVPSRTAGRRGFRGPADGDHGGDGLWLPVLRPAMPDPRDRLRRDHRPAGAGRRRGGAGQGHHGVKADPALAARLRGEAYAAVRARFDAERQSAVLERRLLEIIGTSRV